MGPVMGSASFAAPPCGTSRLPRPFCHGALAPTAFVGLVQPGTHFSTLSVGFHVVNMLLQYLFSLRTALLLLASATIGHAKQQCRLVLNSNLNGGGSPQVPLSATPTSSGASASASATLAPFNYGKDIIRGVNL